MYPRVGNVDEVYRIERVWYQQSSISVKNVLHPPLSMVWLFPDTDLDRVNDDSVR